jgi:fluoride exporter
MTPAPPLPLLPALAAVFVGAGCGACLRHGLNLVLNHRLAWLPLGTLAANLLGAYLVGLAIAFFLWRSELSPLWRLALVTGFLGGLTTFSAFSAEVVGALGSGDIGSALWIVLAHLMGSLVLTALGMATLRALVA